MLTQRDKREFLEKMHTEGMPTGVALEILPLADTIQRLAVKDCNEGLTDSERRLDRECEEGIAFLCKPYGITPVFSGDPWGACVKLRVPSGRTDDWGRTGICVPTKDW